MNRYLLYISLMASSLLAATGCSDELAPAEMDVSKKTPIELTVGVEHVDGLTRAITEDKTNLSSLPQNTSIYMVMKSEHVDDNSKYAKYTLTMGTTGAADNGVSSITFGDGFKRYWDDVYARKAALSVYAVCTPGGTPNAPTIGGLSNYSFTASESNPTPNAWKGTPNTLKISNWKVESDQASLTVAQFNDQDLCYSNNVSYYTVDERTTDNRIKFLSESKQFDRKKRLNFYHALSKITFIVKSGAGFYSFENDFKFSGTTNITMKNMNLKQETFNIEKGEFSGTITQNEISSMFLRESKQEGKVLSYTLDALVIPGTDMSETANNISFSISDNYYEFSKKDLLDKISDADKTANLKDGKYLKPGVHYIFTLTISKTEIKNITASVVDWETVSADYTPTNARLSFSFEDRGTAVIGTSGETFDIYRAPNVNDGSVDETSYFSYDWNTGFSNAGETGTSGNGLQYNSDKWQTNWFWPNNKTFYHLRTVGIKGGTLPTVITDGGKDYFSISASETFSDVIWGAPFKELDNLNPLANTALLTYSTAEGFDGKGAEAETKKHQIHYAIGPTNQAIHIVMFHMMSKVKFVVKTVSGNGAVNLGDGSDGNATTLTLKNIHKSGKVQMGNGCVSATDTRADYVFTNHPAPSASTLHEITWQDYGAIPQSLKDTGNEVVLVITTPDNNKYEVTLKDIWTSNISTHNLQIPYQQTTTAGSVKSYKVDYWYPNYDYTYTFTLTKKGIEDIKVTILDWETVVAGDDNVQIQ